MIKIHPVSEKEAKEDIKRIYESIKIILNLPSVPLIFRYMASFPNYLDFIWNQTIKNLNNDTYVKSSDEISKFALTALKDIYLPSQEALALANNVENDPQKKPLITFTERNIAVSSKLYLLAISIRESIKGKFLGIKQFGEKISAEEKIFTDFTDGFYENFQKENNSTGNSKSSVTGYSNKIIKNTTEKNIVRTHAEELFAVTNQEMKRLAKREDYLTRRVEMERFALNKLYLLPHPLDSSLSAVIYNSRENPLFPELIYLVSELFPTQTPYKLLASVVMRLILN